MKINENRKGICLLPRKEGISAIFKENNEGHCTQQTIDKLSDKLSEPCPCLSITCKANKSVSQDGEVYQPTIVSLNKLGICLMPKHQMTSDIYSSEEGDTVEHLLRTVLVPSYPPNTILT